MVLWPDGKTKSFRVPNTKDEFERLTTFWLDQKLSVRAALEPTGDFHRLITHWLPIHGIETHLASSLACARVREAMFNSWDINDRKDANIIMYLLTQGMTKPFHDSLVHGHMHWQEVANTYHHISNIRSCCYHSLLNHYLPLFSPKFELYIDSSRSEWFCSFLLSFPTPGSIFSPSMEEFIDQSWDVLGRKASKRRLLEEDIYHTARHSVALPIDQDSLTVENFQIQVRR